MIVIAIGVWLWRTAGQETTDDAQVDAHLSAISSRVAGTVTAVYVEENQFVRVGEPIAELPPFRRCAFEPVYSRLKRGLAPAIVLRGPRQVGKTTLLTQVVDQFTPNGRMPTGGLGDAASLLGSLLSLGGLHLCQNLF